MSRALMRLNLDTHAYHAEIDAPWLELTDEYVTRGHYVSQLSRAFGLEGPIEGALAYTPGLAAIIDVGRRARCGLIAQDLLALDVSPAQLTAIELCPGVAPFSTVVDAIGWLYALERSSLLHELVRRHLLARVPDIEGAVTYLSATRGIAER